MRRRNEEVYEDRDSFNPWETYSDLYCGLLLVFVLLFFFAIYQYIAAKEDNNASTQALQESMKEEQEAVLALYRADLADQEAAYQKKNDQLNEKQTELDRLQGNLAEKESELTVLQTSLKKQEDELTGTRTALAEKESELTAAETALSAREEELGTAQALLQTRESELDVLGGQIEVQQTQLTAQQEQLTAQQAQLAAQQALLDEQAAQIEQIVGVRAQLIRSLNERLRADGIEVQADQTTGAITFESSILFELDSNVLSEEGKVFFRTFMPAYMEVLMSDEYREYIAEIIVEGHTDDRGTYRHNLELSQKRALSVGEYCVSEESGVLEEEMRENLKAYMTVNGCADREMVLKADGSVDAEASRRVEMKFRLRDEEMITAMDELLNADE